MITDYCLYLPQNSNNDESKPQIYSSFAYAAFFTDSRSPGTNARLGEPSIIGHQQTALSRHSATAIEAEDGEGDYQFRW